VYVESNFMLEIALKQEQAESAVRILELAREGKIDLAFPLFSLSEPFSHIVFRDLERQRISKLLEEEISSLRRSGVKTSAAPEVEKVPITFGRVSKAETDSLESVGDDMLNHGYAIPLGLEAYRKALDYEDVHGLEPKDSIIYSCIIADLSGRGASEIKCFITKDSKGFKKDTIKSELARFNCTCIFSFDDGLRHIEHELSLPQTL
jgi:hypothetical protein